MLISLPQYKTANHIGIYLSMPKSEICTKNIVFHALQENKKVYVPITYRVKAPSSNGPKDVMDMVSLPSREDYESLQPDNWGIPTPSIESVKERNSCFGDDEITPQHSNRFKPSHVHLDMIIMPGMAFDRNLSRLGHGKGYYDFFLQRYEQSKVANQASTTIMPFLGKFMRLEASHLKDKSNPCGA